MVYIRSLKFSGLYSYSEETEIDLSDRTVLVGPNNSGKSNIMRIIKLVIDTFDHLKRLEESEISHTGNNPFLEIKLTLSPQETSKIVDFLSFYQSGPNRTSEFYKFSNREFLIKNLDNIFMRLSWQREVHGYGSEPFLEINFEKIGIWGGWNMYSGSFPMAGKRLPKLGSFQLRSDLFLCNVLERISNGEDQTQILASLDERNNAYVTLENIRYSNNVELSDEGKSLLQSLFGFMGYQIQSQQEIAFRSLLGLILKRGIYHASGRVSTHDILDIVEALKTHGQGDDFDRQLASRAASLNLARTHELQSDGSNLPQYLFHLMVSNRFEDKEKFEQIKKAFNEIVKADELSVDVSLEYETVQQHVTFGEPDPQIPKRPSIVINDKKLGKRFPLRQVGAGLTEIVYLLTASYGMKNSLIMLDEPSVNLHPPMMKALMRYIENSENKNQFIIITHSAELSQYELFESEADLVYIRKTNHISKIKSLKGEVKSWFEENRSRFKHQIDSRVFFGRCIILTEGESDRNLLGMAHYLESADASLDLESNDVVITSVGGKGNFDKYTKLLNGFGIPHVILADSDARSLFSSPGSITKDGITDNYDIIVTDSKDLEQLMRDIDIDAYYEAEKEFKGSKPTIAYEFAKKVSIKNPDALKPVTTLLKHSIDKSR